MPPYASRTQRLFGQFLDGLVPIVPLVLAVIVDTAGSSLGGPLAMVAILGAFAYFLLADGLPGGQSLGKRLLGMKVVDAESGAPCSFGQSFVRNLMLLVLGPLDWIFIFGDRHQRLGDKAAGTIVVST